MRDTDPSVPGTSAHAVAPAPADGRDSRTARVTRAVVAVAAGTSANPFDRDSYAKATNRGYGDAMGRGLELALTLAAMVGLGWLADHVAGTAPLFTIVFSIAGFVGITAKLWIAYDLEMRQHEEGAIWNRGPARPHGSDASAHSGPDVSAP